jgi:hypothetical protein
LNNKRWQEILNYLFKTGITELTGDATFNLGRARPTKPSIPHGSAYWQQSVFSKQRVTTVAGCEGKACCCTMAGMGLRQPVAQTTACSFTAVRTGVLRSSDTSDAKQVQVYPVTFLL